MIGDNMKPEKITIHCTDTPNGQGVSISHIQEDHQKRFGGIGYHILIQPNGEVFQLRSLVEVGAHVGNANTGNIGICLAGSGKYPRVQLAALLFQIGAVRGAYNIPLWEVYTHAQWPSAIAQGKTCPAMSINRVLSWLAQNDWEAVKPYILDPVA